MFAPDDDEENYEDEYDGSVSYPYDYGGSRYYDTDIEDYYD